MPEPVPLRRPAPTSEPAAPAAPRHRRVLVVEDEYLLAEDLRRGLEDAGAEVLGPVPSVADALALLATEAPPDAAILDVNLGGEMVFPVADVLRERGVPFMFATGYDQWSLPQAYTDVPRCEKPFDVGRCLRTLFG
ncbi:MAG TPA: response regulator [Rubellimicrobium sp.]|nr:response regulator [Rubellimicrobium sp.]